MGLPRACFHAGVIEVGAFGWKCAFGAAEKQELGKREW